VTNNKKRWSIWKKLAIYPGCLALVALLLCAWIVISDTISPRILDGRPDDSPRMAALFLAGLVIILYGIYIICLEAIHAIIVTGKEPLP